MLAPTGRRLDRHFMSASGAATCTPTAAGTAFELAHHPQHLPIVVVDNVNRERTLRSATDPHACARLLERIVDLLSHDIFYDIFIVRLPAGERL
jgi:hypothetical protein